MNEELQDAAALYALGALPPGEAEQFESQMAGNAELRQLTDELEMAVASLGSLVPPTPPPSRLKVAVLTGIRAGAAPAKTAPLKRRPPFPWHLVGWGLAAAFAVSTLMFWKDRRHLSQNVRSLVKSEQESRGELAKAQGERSALEQKVAAAKTETDRLIAEITDLKKSNAVSRMQIATLQSTVQEFKEGVAVVVWDSDQRQGVLKLERMPPVDPQKDYQLWVVDPKRPAPVNAGVVRVDEKGFARVDFKPVDLVSEAAKFALSVEKKGGVANNEGPIVFLGP